MALILLVRANLCLCAFVPVGSIYVGILSCHVARGGVEGGVFAETVSRELAFVRSGCVDGERSPERRLQHRS